MAEFGTLRAFDGIMVAGISVCRLVNEVTSTERRDGLKIWMWKLERAAISCSFAAQACLQLFCRKKLLYLQEPVCCFYTPPCDLSRTDERSLLFHAIKW